MTVFIRDTGTGKVRRYPLIGNVGYKNGYIVIAKDPRISAAVYMLPAEYYEIVRVTETQFETPEAVKAWTDGDLCASGNVHNYIETVFEEA